AIPSNVAALDFNGDKKLDRAFVGDTGGNMWRIDDNLAATKLFSAPANHKIYYAPDVVRDRGFLSVFFGTGDRSNPLETSVVDRMYAIKDDNTSNMTTPNLLDVTTHVDPDRVESYRRHDPRRTERLERGSRPERGSEGRERVVRAAEPAARRKGP